MNKVENRQYSCGASMIELAISMPILMLLGLGTVQGGLLYHAKTTVNYATFEAARKGAVTHAQKRTMRKELGVRLGPVFGGRGDAQDALKAMATATIDVQDPRFTKVEVLNPTAEAFDDWGVYNSRTQKEEIPNSHLRQRHSGRVVKSSGVNLQDANLLKIKVTYGYKMSVPLVDRLFARMMMTVDPANSVFYQSRRFPITSVATVRMQSPAWRDSNVAAIANEGDDQAQPTSLVAAVAQTETVPCDAHGIRDDISSDTLDSLLTSTITADQCSTSSSTISSLLSGSGNSSNSVDGQNPVVTQSALTDCIPN